MLMKFIFKCISDVNDNDDSASHVVIHFVKKYPQYKIVNLDKLDYCSSLLNLRDIEGAPNYKFVKVYQLLDECIQI